MRVITRIGPTTLLEAGKQVPWSFFMLRVDSSSNSPENVRCVVGYIVDLTVIMDGIFRVAAGEMSPKHALQVVNRHERSGRRDAIHRDVRSFIAEAFVIRFSVPGKDLVLERIIDMIKQYSVHPSS